MRRSYGRGLQTPVQRAVYLEVNAALYVHRIQELTRPAPAMLGLPPAPARATPEIPQSAIRNPH